MSSQLAVADPPQKEEETPEGPPVPKRRSPLWAKLLVAFGCVLMVISGAVMVSARVVLDKATGSIGQIDIPEGISGVESGQALTGAMNILLVGVDDGVVENVDSRDVQKEGVRADSVMILHVPESHDRGYLVSLPRDLWVKIPKFPKTGYGGGSDKLNAAYNYGYGNAKTGPGRAGGLELLMLTVRDATGISLNGAATVNFTGFTGAVKMLGGVTMTIDEKVTSVHYGFDKNGVPCVPALFDGNAIAHPRPNCKGRVFERGTRRLSAEEALDYTRQREWMELEDGDYGRQRHQQQFIKALLSEAKAQGLTGNLPKSLNLISSMGSALSVWTNGHKLEDWFFTLKGVASTELVMIKTNNGKYTSAGVNGTSAEALSDESKQMLAALRTGTIAQWLSGHMDWVGLSE